MKKKSIFHEFLHFLAAILVISLFVSAAYLITYFLFKALRISPPLLVLQIINSILGIFIYFILAILLRSRFKMGFESLLQNIISVLERISRGEYNIKIEVKNGEQGRFGELIQSVNKMADDLSQMEKMRQEFVSNVSHEIQSPLTSIKGFAQVLKGSELSSEARLHYLEIIEAECTRLSRLSDNLLKLASLDAETTQFEPKPFRLDRQLSKLVLSCEPQWLAKNIEVEASLEEATIIADEDLLSQVWINLIHNSIKFTPEGGNIAVSLKVHDASAEVIIRDTGMGISEDDLPNIFERFYKADKSRNRSVKGNGLGLSIAKKIIDMHNGTVEVKSQLNEGTEFIITLPLEVKRVK